MLLANMKVAFCQSNEIQPVQFSQIYQNYSLIHPAASGMEASFQAFAGYKSLTSPFQGVNTSYAALNLSTKSAEEDDQNFHGFGANLVSSKEGPYFTRNRVYASYAWHNQLTPEWLLSGGATLGVINYNYKATDIYPGGTATKPTCDAGILFYKPMDTHLGLTASQVIPNNLAPLESQLHIKPYLVFSADKVFELSPSLCLKPILFLRGPVRKNALDIEFTNLLIIQEIVSLGVLYNKGNGASIIAGIETFKSESFDLRFFASYYTPFGINGQLNTSLLEFSVSVFKRN